MPNFNSFVYDVSAAYTPDVIRGDCYAIFRLSPEYKDDGAHFGFDWVRSGDALDYVAHDVPYEGNVGRNFKGFIFFPSDSSDINIKFREDEQMYNSLCRSYLPGNITKKPKHIHLSYDKALFEIQGAESLPCEPGKHKCELCMLSMDGEILPLGGSSSQNYVILEKGSSKSTPVHECLHALGLSHTFNNKHNNGKLTDYTYKVGITDNLMDYSHLFGVNAVNWWEWQWKIARENASPEE